MTDKRKKVNVCHRRHTKERGFVRVAVQVCEDDAVLFRRVADALADPHLAPSSRAFLRDRFASPVGKGLKELLAEAPLEGIDLERSRDTGQTFVL